MGLYTYCHVDLSVPEPLSHSKEMRFFSLISGNISPCKRPAFRPASRGGANRGGGQFTLDFAFGAAIAPFEPVVELRTT
jgi:hypothetical protein